jgi:hypothetical protein
MAGRKGMLKATLFAATLAAAVAPGVAHCMTVEDFLSQAGELTGQTVDVSGRAICLSDDVCGIYSDKPWLRNVTFSAVKLPREVRGMLLHATTDNPVVATITLRVHGEIPVATDLNLKAN